jgi:hypothetical protein
MKPHYKTLGVDENATQAEIKKAYKQKVKDHHPDTNGGNDDEIKAINQAKILLDPEKRKRYDNGEPEQPSRDPVLDVMAHMIMKQLSEGNFDNKKIWKALINENKKLLNGQKRNIQSAIISGKQLRDLSKHENIIGKIAFSEYTTFLKVLRDARNVWSLNRKVKRFIEKDCECIDEIMKETEEPVMAFGFDYNTSIDKFFIRQGP